MSAPAWTPGPWRSQGWVPTWVYIPVHDAQQNLVCSVYPTGRTAGPDFTAGAEQMLAHEQRAAEETTAVAALIAAAPELYAALAQILADWEAVGLEQDVPDEININPHWDAVRAALAKARGEP